MSLLIFLKLRPYYLLHVGVSLGTFAEADVGGISNMPLFLFIEEMTSI